MEDKRPQHDPDECVLFFGQWCTRIIGYVMQNEDGFLPTEIRTQLPTGGTILITPQRRADDCIDFIAVLRPDAREGGDSWPTRCGCFISATWDIAADDVEYSGVYSSVEQEAELLAVKLYLENLTLMASNGSLDSLASRQ